MNIKIKKHLLLYKNYKLKCSIGKSGITSFKRREILQHQKEHLNLVRFITEKIELDLQNVK